MQDDFLIHKLKNNCQIEHHRHRWNFLANLLSGLMAYCQDPEKPTLHLQGDDVLFIERFAA